MVSALASVLRRLATLALALVVCFGLIVSTAEANKTISPEDMAVIRRQAEGFMEAKSRLPELATLVNEKDWIHLLHGPMQDLGREMLYINQRLLPADRREANKLATELKTALAELDEAARRRTERASARNTSKWRAASAPTPSHSRRCTELIQSTRVGVIGAGFAGSCTAWLLTRQGFDVSLIGLSATDQEPEVAPLDLGYSWLMSSNGAAAAAGGCASTHCNC